jgi:taurine dioxygenase
LAGKQAHREGMGMSTSTAPGMNGSLDRIEATPLNGTFGARIDGIDLSRPLGSQAIERLMELLRQHKVLTFRDQFAVGPNELLAFAQRFGTPEAAPHPTHADFPGLPGVKVLVSDAEDGFYEDSWHTDGATRESTRMLSILQAVDVPPYGRDTVFADMEAAYEQLSKPMRELLGGLWAVHSWGPQKPDAPPVEHPVILEDAVSGRKTLYVNRAYTRSIAGLRRAESETLLKYFFSLTHLSELQLRVSWKPGSIVMWDNEKTQHYLVRDLSYRRVMHRVMLFV